MGKKITHCGQMSQVHLRIKESGVNALRLRLEFAITRGDQGLIDWAYQCVREYYGCSMWFIIYVYIHEYVGTPKSMVDYFFQKLRKFFFFSDEYPSSSILCF